MRKKFSTSTENNEQKENEEKKNDERIVVHTKEKREQYV